jgi:uncharacterized OB-fold protein
VDGRGEIDTFGELPRAPMAELAESVPYHVGMIQLREGTGGGVFG